MKNSILLFLLFIPNISNAKTANKAECDVIKSFKKNLEVIALNIANHKTTRTIAGGSYIPKSVKCANGTCRVINENKPPMMTYEPKHPDADQNGYVSYPDINLVLERSRFQLMAERLIAAAADNKCGMRKGLNSKTMTSVSYNGGGQVHSFIMNNRGEIIIWEESLPKGRGSILNLLAAVATPKKLVGDFPTL